MRTRWPGSFCVRHETNADPLLTGASDIEQRGGLAFAINCTSPAEIVSGSYRSSLVTRVMVSRSHSSLWSNSAFIW